MDMDMDEGAWQQYWGGAEAIEFGDKVGDGGHNVDFDSPGTRARSRQTKSRQGEAGAAVDVTFEDLRVGALDPIPTTNSTKAAGTSFSKPSSRQGGRRVDNSSHIGQMRALSRGGTANGTRERGSSRGSHTPGMGDSMGLGIRLLSAKHELSRTPSNRELTSAGGRRSYSRDNSSVMNVMVALNG